MRNEFEASTNVMHEDLLQELTEKIREDRQEEHSPVVEIEAEAEADWQPAPIPSPLVPAAEVPSAIETDRIPVGRSSSLWVVALLVFAFTVGFFATLQVLPVVRYVRAHQALVVPPPAAIPDPPPPVMAVAVAEAPVTVAPPPPEPVRAPHKHHRKHSRRHH